MKSVWDYDPISRGLKLVDLRLDAAPGGSVVWDYDPISRGLKHLIDGKGQVVLVFQVWDYDPISRGLKRVSAGDQSRRKCQRFGTMTRFLGD